MPPVCGDMREKGGNAPGAVDKPPKAYGYRSMPAATALAAVQRGYMGPGDLQKKTKTLQHRAKKKIGASIV